MVAHDCGILFVLCALQATSEGGEENEDTGSNKKAATASHKSAPSSSPTGAVVATKNPLMEVVNFGEEEGP